MRWVDALKEYAKKNGKYVVPKKGSKEYDEVRAIMGAAKGEAKAEEAKGEHSLAAAHKAEGAALAAVEKAHKAEGKAVERTGKVRKPRAPKAVAVAAEGTAAPVAPAEPKKPKGRKPRKSVSKKVEGVSTKSQNALDSKPRKSRKAKEAAGSIPAGADIKGATEKAVSHSKNPEAVLEQMTNAHLPVNPSGKVPQLRLPKGVAFDSEAKLTAGEMEMPSLVDVSRPTSAAPFSFNALRRQLGA